MESANGDARLTGKLEAVAVDALDRERPKRSVAEPRGGPIDERIAIDETDARLGLALNESPIAVATISDEVLGLIGVGRIDELMVLPGHVDR